MIVFSLIYHRASQSGFATSAQQGRGILCSLGPGCGGRACDGTCAGRAASQSRPGPRGDSPHFPLMGPCTSAGTFQWFRGDREGGKQRFSGGPLGVGVCCMTHIIPEGLALGNLGLLHARPSGRSIKMHKDVQSGCPGGSGVSACLRPRP